MGRVFFPTYSLNRFGTRETDQQATLGAAIERFPAEPNPRAAQNPTPPILGAVGLAPTPYAIRYDGPYPAWPRPILPAPRPPIVAAPMPAPAPPVRTFPAPPPTPPSGPSYPVTPLPIIVSSGGGGQVAPTIVPPAPPSVWPQPIPVSQQAGPTPTVTLPAPAPTGAVLVSSGGGTQTPSTSTIVAAAPAPSSDFVSGIATWLQGVTPIFNYNVPNALLAGAVVLGFAFLSSSGKKR